ncbi:hypothetical protein VDGD_02472 [Verticillium dahliae]|nr:hypothetical protein VDGD_02472 [Verticillium dahliae]
MAGTKRKAPAQSKKDAGAPPVAKKHKKFQVDDSLLDMDLGLNKSFSVMDNQLLADYLAQKISRFGSDLSSIEVSDLTVSGKCVHERDGEQHLGRCKVADTSKANAIRDTTSWDEPRTAEKLPEFLEKFAEKPERLSSAPSAKGTPHTIIVAGAGLRAADLVRATRKFQTPESTVSKLFAKHMKVDEQTKFLQSQRTGIAVGTPARLMALVDNGALSLAKLDRIVVDASHIDQKKRGVMDMKETMLPLAQWLTRNEFKDRYVDEKKPLALLFY